MEKVKMTKNSPKYGFKKGDEFVVKRSIIYELTPQGRKKCERYLKELQAKRKEILDAGIDTVHETSIDYTPEELLEDVLLFGIDEDGDAWNSSGVTDHYRYEFPLNLRLGEDFEEVKKEAKHHE